MKHIFALIWIVPFFSRAQDCNLKTMKDPYTREIKISTGLISLNNGQFSVEATKSEIDFMFSVDGKCFDNASTAAVFFEGTRVKTNLKNSGTMNCEGPFSLYIPKYKSIAVGPIKFGSKKNYFYPVQG